MAGGEPRFGTLSTYMALSMPRLPRQSQQNSLVYMGMVSRGNPPDNEPNQSLAAPSNKKLRLGDVLRWRIGDLDAVSECDALDDFGQLVLALQPAPGFGRCHDQLEHHQPGRVLRQCALGPHRAMPHRCEHALDWIGGSQMVPGLGGKVVEG